LELPPYHFLRDIKNNYIQNKEAKTTIRNIFPNTIEIETDHLPLLLTKYDLGSIIKNPKFGGICSAGNLILGISWQGEGYFINQETGLIKKISIRLPNSKELFESKYPGVTKVYDIECHLDNKTGNIEAFVTYDFIDGTKKSMKLSRVWLSNSQDNIQMIGDSELLYELDSGPIEGALTQQGKIKLLKSGKILFSGSYRLSEAVKTDAGDVVEAAMIILFDPDTKKSSIYSKGHRVTQGIEETDSGEIYSTEHGPKGGDELNHIVEGSDYGWPFFTHGANYETYGWRELENIGRHDYTNYKGPLFSWVPSIATSPLIQVRNFNDRWNGDLLIGTLKNRSLYRIRIKDDAVRFVERVWIGERIRDLINTPEQKIVFLTDVKTILVLEVNEPKLELNQGFSANVRSKEMQKCTTCHHFGEINENHPNPSLTGVIGRKIASDNYKRYSDALLAHKDKVWTKELLTKFLENPNEFAPGTSMPKVELLGTEIERLVQDLSQM
jgi:cytochrome c2